MGVDQNNWAEDMNNLLGKQVEGVREQEIRFLRIEEFSHIIERIDKYSEACMECQEYIREIEAIIPDINHILLHPGKPRKKYDQLINRISKHLRQNHGVYPELYFTYLLSAVGMGIGFVIGMIAETLRWLLLNKLSWELWLGAIIIGLVFGHLKGLNKDAKVKKSGKRL